MEIVEESPQVINKAVEILKSGGLVIFPTETVYIAAVDATNPKAVKKLIKYKNRPFGKPFSVGMIDLKMAREYIDMNKTALDIYKSFYPGPVTIVSKGKHRVASGIESESGTLGIFVTNHKLTMDIIRKLGKPVTTTSANASYQPRPFNIHGLLKNLSGKQKKLIDLMVDAGRIPEREASTVIDTTQDDPAVLRQGELKIKDKIEILSRSEENTQNIGKELWQKYEKYIGKRPIIFALEGPMGAGKTQFTKGLGRAMGITDEIVSPTFSLVLNYEPRTTNYALTHIDAWRMSSDSELVELGFVKILEDKNMVIAIEWADRVVDAIKKERDEALIIWVKIAYGKGENERLISWGAL